MPEWVSPSLGCADSLKKLRNDRLRAASTDSSSSGKTVIANYIRGVGERQKRQYREEGPAPRQGCQTIAGGNATGKRMAKPIRSRRDRISCPNITRVVIHLVFFKKGKQFWFKRRLLVVWLLLCNVGLGHLGGGLSNRKCSIPLPPDEAAEDFAFGLDPFRRTLFHLLRVSLSATFLGCETSRWTWLAVPLTARQTDPNF